MTRALLITAGRLALGLALFAPARPALAGPAKYDPKTRSFQLSYTYAALPHFNMSSEEIEALGQLQTATPEQEAKVRAIHQSVSQILEEVTGKRARIGSFEYVESIKKADIIISLTGLFDRAGWATLGTIEGQPGQVGLYYQYLDQKPPQEVALTVAHELCHYLFALPDEYSSGIAPECPLQNPDSPGCLMDNYLNRHGFRRICVDSEHNPGGPQSNPGTILNGHRAEDSCQHWVDEFFKKHPPDPAVDVDGDGVPDPPNAMQGSTPDEPFTGAFRQVVNSATLFVQEKVAADRKKNGDKARFPDASALARMADDYFKQQLKELAADPGFVPPNKEQVKAATLAVAQRLLSQPIKPPSKFTKDLVTQLKARAAELASASPRKGNDLLKLLFADQPPTAKDLKPTIDKVKNGLLEFLKTPGAKALLGTVGLAPEDQRYVDQIAREAVVGPGGSSEFAAFLDAAKLHIRLSLNTTKTLNAIANELDLPGSRARRVDLSGLETQLDKFRLPGKPFTGFGFRRTYVVAPHPINPAFDRVQLDAGDNLPYHDVRNLAVGEFMRLVQRERAEFVNDPLTGDPISIQRLDALTTGTGPVAARPLNSGERTARQNELIAKLIEAVRRERVENVVFLAPPGGLGNELGESLEEFRAAVLDDTDVRVDVVILGSGTIPLRLRDLAAQSGGSVQLGVDLDEVGAISQRLKNEIAAGSWVSTPQRGYIDFSANTSAYPAPAHGARRDPEDVPTFASLQARFKGRRRYVKADAKAGDCDEEWPLTDSGDLKPSFDLSLDEIDAFLRRLTLINANFVRTEARTEPFTPVISRLFRLRLDIERLGRQLDDLAWSKPGEAAHRKLHDLLDSVFNAKQSLRPIFGSARLFKSPLTSTDDYFDWSLRKLLKQEAGELQTRSDLTLVKDPKAIRHFSSLRLKATDFLERASEQDQTLADRTDALSDVDNAILSSIYREITGFMPDVSKLRRQSRDLRAKVDSKQRELAAKNADAAPLLLEASENELLICESFSKARARGDFAGDPKQDQSYEEFQLALILSTSHYLEKASTQPIDPAKFGDQVARARNFFNEVGGRIRPRAKAADPADVRSIEDLLKVLEQRSERLIGRGGVADPLAGAIGKKSSFDVDDPFDKTNALSPIIESLLPDRELPKAVRTLSNQLNAEKCKSLYELLYIQVGDDSEVIRDRVEEFVHGDFPLLLLNVLGRLREFEYELQAVEAAYHDAGRPVPTFQRLNRPRVKARPDLDEARDGHLVGITFDPFQVEDAAEMELIIGLSRPLRNFERLRDEPPRLKLYRGATTEFLVDTPYLAYDHDVSTETMLVYRVPKPLLKAGFLKAGQYTPRLICDQKYMPILGRDNTVNYTFSVATIRPNVQLIAALRQPQPKDGDREFGKDQEDAYRGTLAANASEAIVEVQVLAGAPVTKADVSGQFQRVDATSLQIDSPRIDFLDDGVYPDLKKDDGIYTGRIALQPPTSRKPSEYRVFIQARSNDAVKFIPLAEPIPVKSAPNAKDPDLPRVPAFQRATSLNFHASSDN